MNIGLGEDLQDSFGPQQILVASAPGIPVEGNSYANSPWSVLFIQNGIYWTGLYGPRAYNPGSMSVQQTQDHGTNFHKAYHTWVMNCS